MKKTFFTIIFIFTLTGSVSYAQDLHDFYKRRGLGTCIVYSNFKCTSPAYERLHSTNTEKYNSSYSQFSFPLLIALDLPEIASTKKWGFHYQARVLMATDLWGALLSKQKTSHALTSLINMRLGLNLYTNDQLVVRGGIGGGVWGFSAFGSGYDSNTNPTNQYKDFPFTYGPYIGADYAINDWIAARVMGEYSTGIILSNSGDGHIRYPSPKIWTWNFELFTRPGFFLALDLYRMPKVIDYAYNVDQGTSFKYSRTDIMFGWKYKFKN